MKILALILAVFLSLPGMARASCACLNAPAIATWSMSGWLMGFVLPFTLHSTVTQLHLGSIAGTDASAGLQRAAVAQGIAKAASQAEMQNRFLTDDVNRRASAEMQEADLAAVQDTLGQKPDPNCGGSTLSGSNGIAFSQGANSALALESVIASEMNRDRRKDIGQGTDVIDYRLQALKEFPSDTPRTILPENGRLTFTEKEMQAATHFTAMSANTDGRLPAEKIGLKGKKAELYNSLIAQRQYLTSLTRDPIADALVEKAPLVDAAPLQAMAAVSRTAGNGGDVYQSQNKKISREAQRAIWAQYHLSPAVSDHLRLENAPSAIHEVMAKQYASMLEGLVAMKRMAMLLAMSTGESLSIIDKRLDALSLPASNN